MSLAPLLRRKRPTASQFSGAQWGRMFYEISLLEIFKSYSYIKQYLLLFIPSSMHIKRYYKYLIYITDQQIHKGFQMQTLAPLCSDNELYLRTVHLRTTMPVLAVMLLTNKAIQKRHSAADLIFSGQIYFYLITMGCILMGNIPHFF